MATTRPDTAREANAAGPPRKVLEVTVVLLGGNFASTALAPIEVFYSAGLLWAQLHAVHPEPRFRVTAASLDGRPVMAGYGVSLAPQAALVEIERSDLVIVPASGLDLDGQLRRYRALYPWLREQHAWGSHVAGICTGTAYLAEAGLLDGRRATTHWALADAYRRRYPQVRWCPELFITEEQRVLCSGGVFAAVDLSLYLVEKFCGRDVALECARSLLVDMPRTHQSGYALLPLSRPHDDERIRDVEHFMARHCGRDLPVKRLCAQANMSARTFLRRFKAATGRLPGEYLQLQRVAIARERLENGAESIAAVGRAVGYADAASFRKVFRRATGMTPLEYRHRFAGERLPSRADVPG
ncbi:helix-turn-helix domain-containing protein [Billgrantia azerbaijanica]|nr:helix-turn-helix domain-containing protein [Halomonas azerbaijanica]